MQNEGQKSDLKRAFTEDGALKTHVGGQALLEGIMMRGKYNWAVAVREPNQNIYVEEHDLASGLPKNGWLRWPVIRGCTAFIESLMLGFKALEIAALHAFSDSAVLTNSGNVDAAVSPGAQSAFVPSGSPTEVGFAPIRETISGTSETLADSSGASEAEATQTKQATYASPSDSSSEAFGHAEMVFSMVLGLVLGVALFIVAPAFITNLIVGEYDEHTLAWNVVDGLLRVAVFIFYIWLIGRMKDIQRMFGYHGAEHKTIHCYEHGLALTPENARSFPRLHVRCGTAFLIMVMILAIFIYTITPLNTLITAWGVPDGAPKLMLVIIVRILLMPLIAGVAYEITVKWAGSHPENPLVKVILWPGMQMQYLTTREPDDGQIECAIAAMQQVLEREQAEEAAA